MQKILPQNLITLALHLPTPLYVVGGSVRDFLANLPLPSKLDLDICAPLSAEEFAQIATKLGFSIKAIYKNTGTVKLQDSDKIEYEFSSFRSDKYVRGIHTPVEICFTNDILLDSRRRDFTCNAVYYDIQNNTYLDPLNDGISAIKEKRLTTVAPAEKVFGEDGLRLMRLARQSATLGFTPDNSALDGARKNCALICDIAPERIFAELTAILQADQKYGVKDGHYRGLKILESTGVFAHILPELTLGKDMAQRPDFHRYTVLEHSLRAVLYADKSIRLSALLHDIGKPYCTLRDSNSHKHAEEGERIVGEILARLKAPSKTITSVKSLVKWHMYDFNCQAGENKIRRFLVTHYPIIQELLLLKQADFSACADNTTVAPTVKKWQEILAKMQAEHTPFTLKQLAVNGQELITLGVAKPNISKTLNALLLHCAVHSQDNKKERLLKLARSFCERLGRRE